MTASEKEVTTFYSRMMDDMEKRHQQHYDALLLRFDERGDVIVRFRDTLNSFTNAELAVKSLREYMRLPEVKRILWEARHNETV